MSGEGIYYKLVFFWKRLHSLDLRRIFFICNFGLIVSVCWDKTVFNYYSLHYSVAKNKVDKLAIKYLLNIEKQKADERRWDLIYDNKALNWNKLKQTIHFWEDLISSAVLFKNLYLRWLCRCAKYLLEFSVWASFQL